MGGVDDDVCTALFSGHGIAFSDESQVRSVSLIHYEDLVHLMAGFRYGSYI